MTYRDENEALRARVGALQDEVADLKDEIAKRDVPAPKTSTELARPPAARLHARPARVHVVRGQGSLQVVIERELVWDKLRDQAPLGFGFSFVVAGPFVVVPIALALPLPFAIAILVAIALYAVTVGVLNLAWAAITRRRWVLDVTAAGDFVLHHGSSARPRLAGRGGKLETRLTDSDPASLGCVWFDDGRRSIAITHLTNGDLELLRNALPDHARLAKPDED